MALGPRFPFVEPAKHRVPREWQHVVCICPEDRGTKHDLEAFGNFMLCRGCGLLKRFYTSHCSNCKEFYLRVFKHPAWNPHRNWCFMCLVEHNMSEWECNSKTYVPPPEWAHPIPPPTEEEIKAALDDFFTDVVDSNDLADFDF